MPAFLAPLAPIAKAGLLRGGAYLANKFLRKKAKEQIKKKFAASNAEKIVKIVPKPTKNISSTAKTSAKDLKKLLKQRRKNFPEKTTLGTLAKGAGIGTGLEMMGSEVGRKTGVDLPDLSFSQQLLAPRTANAPLNKKPKKNER